MKLLATGESLLGSADVIAANQSTLSSTPDRPYFRGTSAGYEGSPALRRTGVTPVSEDPVVATAFAVESERFGEGVVHIIKSSSLTADEVLEGNVLASLEREVGIAMLPEEVAARATTTIPSAQSRSILSSMGIKIPASIPSKAALTDFLQESPRLDAQQIQQFVDMAQETRW